MTARAWLPMALMMLGLLFLGRPPAQPTGQATLEPTAAATSSSTGLTGKIVFVSVTGTDSQIETINADGTGLRQLTNNHGTNWNPTWSPDGRHIAFASRLSGHYEIYIMEEDGSNIQQITHGASDSGDGGLSWSPNGEQVAYTVKTTSDPDFDSDIYIMDSDGSNPHDITNDLARNREPIWSPDGKEIIFETNRNDPSDPAHTQIYIMNADGTNARPLTDEGRSASAPVMSPDGKHIIYYSIGLTADAHAADGLYIMNADGANPILFTSKIYLDPTFSPDGTHLAVVSFDLKNGKRISNIYIVDVDGSNPVKLTSVDGDYRLLKWGR